MYGVEGAFVMYILLIDSLHLVAGNADLMMPVISCGGIEIFALLTSIDHDGGAVCLRNSK